MDSLLEKKKKTKNFWMIGKQWRPDQTSRYVAPDLGLHCRPGLSILT